MQSSAYYAQLKSEYKKKKEEIQAIRTKVANLTGFVTPCIEEANSTKTYADKIIIMGESMDKGSLSTDVIGNLNKISQNIETILSECDKLISKYTELYNEADRNYNQALAEEEAARRRAAQQKTNPNDLKKV